MKERNRIQLGVIVCTLMLGACGHGPKHLHSEDTMEQKESTESLEEEVLEEEQYKVSSMEDLLALETQEYYGPIYEDREVSAREEAALELANRVVTMYNAIDYSEADNVWMWAEAVDQMVWDYAKENKIKYDTAVYDLHEALSYYGYDVKTQSSMNAWAYYLTAIQTYDAAVRYKQLIDHITDPWLKTLVRAEYNAWFEWMDAQYFTNTYYTHGADHYSALPLDFWAFHEYHTNNRLAVLNMEEEVLVKGKSYRRRGRTVTGKEWLKWLEKRGYHEGMSPDFNMDEPTDTDFPALIKEKTEKWLAARQAVAQYLGDKKGKGQSYDFLTADIHACIIGKLKPLVKMEEV